MIWTLETAQKQTGSPIQNPSGNSTTPGVWDINTAQSSINNQIKSVNTNPKPTTTPLLTPIKKFDLWSAFTNDGGLYKKASTAISQALFGSAEDRARLDRVRTIVDQVKLNPIKPVKMPTIAIDNKETPLSSMVTPDTQKIGQEKITPILEKAEKPIHYTELFTGEYMRGLTGGFIAPEYEAPKNIAEKVTATVGIVAGSVSSMTLIGEAIGAVAGGIPVFQKLLSTYPKIARYAYPLLKNAVVFDIYGQLNPNIKNRLESLAIDTVKSIPYTALGYVANPILSIPASFGLGYGMTKLEGGSNEDALINGFILSILDGFGRIGKAGEFIDGRTTDKNLKAEAVNVFNKYSENKINNKTSIEEISKYYRDMAKKYHPDLGADPKIMTSINSAYEFLTGKTSEYKPQGKTPPAPKNETQPVANLESATKEIVKTTTEDLFNARSFINKPENYRSDIERTNFTKLEDKPLEYKDRYIELFDNIVSTDNAVRLFDGYKGDNYLDYQKPGTTLKNIVFNDLLNKRKDYGNKTVLITAGSPGAGKTSALSDVIPKAELKQFPVVLDTTLANKTVPKEIDEILKKGFKVHITYVLRDPVDAWKNVLKRVETEGRTLQETYSLNVFDKARNQVLSLVDQYKNNKNVTFGFIDNRGQAGEAKEVNIDIVREFKYNRDEALLKIKSLTDDYYYKEGKLTDSQYKSLTADRNQTVNNTVDGTLTKPAGEKKPEENITSISNSMKTLIEEARKYKSVEEFIKAVRGSATQYNEYNPKLRATIGLTEDSARLSDLGIDPEKKITIYRGIADDTVKNPKINDGDFVTTDYESAKSYAGKNVISKEVKAKDLIVDSASEFDKNDPFYIGAEFVYSDNKNKLANYTKKQLVDIYNQATEKGKNEEISKPERGEIKTLNDRLNELVGFQPQGEHWKLQYHIREAYIDNAILNAPSEIKQEISSIIDRLQNIRQQKSYSSGNKFSSVGRYANLENITEANAKYKIIPFPEMVRFVKELLGEVPQIGGRFKDVAINEQTGGYFVAGGDGKIVLNPKLFKDPYQASRTLSHEIGHLIDYLPDKSMKRGNLLGRLATLMEYRKWFLGEDVETPEGITPKEYRRLKRQAEKLAQKPVLIEEEIVVGEAKATPEEVLAIWNDMNASTKYPELLKYIQKLSEAEKIEIVKNAMKKTLPQWFGFKNYVKKKITREVIQNAPEDVKRIYQELIREEIIKRGLVHYVQVRNELKELTMKWRPFLDYLDPGYTKYRYSGQELYADAISVLFNDPARLKTEAPIFWDTFFKFLDRKPEVKTALFELYDLLNSGEEAIFKERDKQLNQAFEKAEEIWKAKEEERRARKTSLMHTIRLLFDNKNQPIIEKQKEVLKKGGIIADDKNPVYALQEQAYFDGKLAQFVQDRIEPLYKESQDIPEGWRDLGKMLLLERAIYERGTMANPQGYTPNEAWKQLQAMEKDIGKENWEKLQALKKKFRIMVTDMTFYAEENGFYTPDLLKQMKANPAYATFQVIDYLDTYISAHVYQQVGTLKDVANPATSTVMKMVSLFRSIERNNVKKINIDFLKEHFGDEIIDAKTAWNGRARVIVDTREPDFGTVRIIRNGEVVGYDVDREIADILNGADSKTIRATAKISQIITQSRVYRPLFTVFNLGFQSFNFVRDFWRYWKNVPDYTLSDALMSFPRAVIRYGEALPHAVRNALDIPDTLIKEMRDKKILGATYNDYFRDVVPEEEQIERVLRMFGEGDAPEKKNVLTGFIKAMDVVSIIGDTIEKLPKIAGYIELQDKMPEKQLGEFVRTSIGSPDFRTGGKLTSITNNIFLFSNAIKEGLKSDFRIAFKKNPSRSGFWWKTVIANFLPKVIMAGILGGLMGEKLKKMMEKTSEYNRTNYTIIPLYLDKNDKAVALRIPQDETGRLMGALFWKLLNLSKSNDLISDVSDLFSFGAGQLPNLSPIFTGAGATIDYLAGNNPYDSFRHRNIIPDTEFKAGWKRSLPIFLDWLAKNQGIGIVAPSKIYSQDPTKLESALSLPVISNILGRWITVTDYGNTETEQKINKEIQSQSAEKTLKNRELIDQYIKMARGVDENEKNRLKREMVEKALGKPPYKEDQKTQRTTLLKKFDIGLIKGSLGREMDSLISATSNDFKLELIKRYKQSMDNKEYTDMIGTAYRHKIISGDLLKELRRNKLY